MATIRSITAGKLLQEFIKGYNGEPFGSQGLVIAKQLLDLAFPGKSLQDILTSKEITKLLYEADSQFNLQKQPVYHALTNFLKDKSHDQLQRMKESELKDVLVSAHNVDQTLTGLDLERTAFNLSGNPESASLARDSLGGALISTTASLFRYLLIEGENQAGKIFRDLNTSIHDLAILACRINPFISLLKEIITFKWNQFSPIGCFPQLSDLQTKNICKFVEEHLDEYLEKIKENYFKKLDEEFRTPLLSLIDECKLKTERQDSDFNLIIDLEFPRFEKIKNQVITDLEKLQTKMKSRKKVGSKDFKNIKENLKKDSSKIEQKADKEFQNFKKQTSSILFQEPQWFKFHKRDSKWTLEPIQNILDQLNQIITIEGAIDEGKSKTSKQVISIFQQLGGIHFALEVLVSHYFYEHVPFRLIKLVETPAKTQKIKELRYLQEMRYNEGMEAVRELLTLNSDIMISTIINNGFNLLKDSYMKENPPVFIEENGRNPSYMKLLEIPKDLFGDKSTELFLGKDPFIIQTKENSFAIGLRIKLRGRGNDLFSLLISSACIESSEIYKKATKVLGDFSGYVYSAAIGNMRICPPALKEVNDLFM